MSTKALEPELDAVSLQALVAVAPRGLRGDDLRKRKPWQQTSLWEVAERVGSTDLQDVELTLNGLEHLGYIAASTSAARGVRVWWRTSKGEEALNA